MTHVQQRTKKHFIKGYFTQTMQKNTLISSVEHEDVLKNALVFYVHRMKISAVQCCFEPRWLSLYGETQLKHLKYMCVFFQKKKSDRMTILFGLFELESFLE